MGAAGNRRQTAERSLEQFADELRLSVVERDAVRTTGALARTLSDPLVGRRRHAGGVVGRAAAERRRLGDRDDFVEMDDLRFRTLLKLRELDQHAPMSLSRLCSLSDVCTYCSAVANCIDLEIDRVERIDSTRLKIDRLHRLRRLASHCL